MGGGSYHWEVADTEGGRAFVTVDDLGQKAWLGETRDEVFEELRCAFDTSAVLWEGGLDFVVAPIPARDGGALRRLDARYSIALFPFVDGEAGVFGRYDDEGRRAVLELIAAASSGDDRRRLGRADGRARGARSSPRRGGAPASRRSMDRRPVLGAGTRRGA